MRYWGQRSVGLAFLLVGAMFVAGCGKSGGSGDKIIVKGKVTVDEKSADGVVLTFYGPKDKAASGTVTTQADGSYEVMFAAQSGEGNYKVTASKWQMKKGGAIPLGEGIDEEQLKLSGAAVNILPDRYNNADQSGLSAALQMGKNEKDFALKSK